MSNEPYDEHPTETGCEQAEAFPPPYSRTLELADDVVVTVTGPAFAVNNFLRALVEQAAPAYHIHTVPSFDKTVYGPGIWPPHKPFAFNSPLREVDREGGVCDSGA